ncbi:MAG: LysR family transcriptional regulator [Pseudobdellovibrio sp.]
METFELRYFLAAAELESINKAALRLSVSAPAISRAITRLEEELGVKLFERVGRNVAISVHGKQLQREVSRIIGSLDEVKSKFKPANYNYSITISGTEFGFSSYLSLILKKLKSAKLSFITEIKLGAEFHQTGSTQLHKWDPVSCMNGSHLVS